MSNSSDDLVVGVLALQGDVREHEQSLRALGVGVRRVRQADDLDGLSGLVLPGGESTTMAKLAATFGMLDPLRAVVRSGLPVYGTCAGMILLADRVLDAADGQETIGGLDVTVRRNAFGRQVASFETDLSVPAFGPEPMRAVFIRAPWIEQVGDGVEVLARVPGHAGIHEHAADRIVVVRQGDIVGTSFHPELTGDTRAHRYFLQIVRAARERVGDS